MDDRSIPPSRKQAGYARRRARQLPVGHERNDLRQLALGLRCPTTSFDQSPSTQRRGKRPVNRSRKITLGEMGEMGIRGPLPLSPRKCCYLRFCSRPSDSWRWPLIAVRSSSVSLAHFLLVTCRAAKVAFL